MKNKKILLIIMILILFITGNVKAKLQNNAGHEPGKEPGACGSGGGKCWTQWMYVKNSNDTQCFFSEDGGSTPGIRITIVNENGERVSKSIDLVGKPMTDTPSDLQLGHLQYDNDAYDMDLYVNSEKATRNEAVSGEIEIITNNTPEVYYSERLEKYRADYSGFINNMDKEFANQLLNLLDRPGLFESSEIEKYYFLLEPLTFIEWHKSGKYLSTIYGTVTEAAYIQKSVEDLSARYGNFDNDAGKLVVTEKYRDGELKESTAGLESIQDIDGVSKYRVDYFKADKIMDTTYGVASAHIWLRDILIDTCPDGSPIPPGGKDYCESTKTCDPKPVNSLTSDCTNGTSGKIYDDAEWSCVYKMIDQPADTYKGQFYHPNGNDEFSGTGDNSNPYCTVACKEEIEVKFSNSFDALAGTRFTIGSSNEYSGIIPNVGPLKIIGTSTCQTGYQSVNSTDATINNTKFEKDLAAADNAVKAAWDEYQKALLPKRAVEGLDNNPELFDIKKEKCSDGKIKYCYKIVEYKDWDDKTITGGSGGEHTYCVDTPLEEANKCSYTGRGAAGGEGGKINCAEDVTVVEVNPDEYADVIYYSSTATYPDTNPIIRYKKESTCSALNSKDSLTSDEKEKINSTYQNYLNAVAKRDGIIAKYRECSSFRRTYAEFNPSLKFAYSEILAKSYNNVTNLAKSVTIESTSIYDGNNKGQDNQTWYISPSTTATYDTDGANAYGNTNTEYVFECSGYSQCTKTKLVPIPTNTKVEQITVKTFEFMLPANLYTYVTKDGKSWSDEPTNEYNTIPNKNLERSNLPISYDVCSGKYSYYIDYENDDTLFGVTQKFTKFKEYITNVNWTDGWEFGINNPTSLTALAYHCNINVKEEILKESTPESRTEGTRCIGPSCAQSYKNGEEMSELCNPEPDPKPVDIIYRPIFINDDDNDSNWKYIFPGENGDGRNPGANWDYQVSGYSAHAQFNGMGYVQAFIQNNRGVKGNEVYNLTPMYEFILSPTNIRNIRKYNKSLKNNYNDYDMVCENGEYCRSKFLMNGIDEGYFTFTNIVPQGGTCFGATSTNWESCRY